MATTTELLSKALGTEKLTLLAHAVDLLQEQLNSVVREESVDDQLEVLELSILACQHGISEATLRKRIEKVMGASVVVKPGKKRVIRKKKWLEYLQRLESGTAQDQEELN